MFNNKFSIFSERLHPSGLADKIRERWGVDYHAVENMHRSLLAERPDLLQPAQNSQPPQAAISHEQPRALVDTSRVGGNVFNLAAYGEQRQQMAQDVEALNQQRLADQARVYAEEAHREAAA